MVSAAAGAFLYHMYAKIAMIEQAVESAGQHVSLGALLDIAKTEEDETDELSFGFNPRSNSRRNVNVNV